MAAVVLAEPTLTVFQAFVLGAVQGITELLPISSSAHLYLFPTLLCWPYAGVTFDIALHAGTLLALVVAFLDDWRRMAVDFFSSDAVKRNDARTLLAMIAVATVPGLMAGWKLGDLEDKLRTLPYAVPLMASLLLAFGLLLWAADRFSRPGPDERMPGLSGDGMERVRDPLILASLAVEMNHGRGHEAQVAALCSIHGHRLP
jgi:undecaprenyl-diphosphatase